MCNEMKNEILVFFSLVDGRSQTFKGHVLWDLCVLPEMVQNGANGQTHFNIVILIIWHYLGRFWVTSRYCQACREDSKVILSSDSLFEGFATKLSC